MSSRSTTKQRVDWKIGAEPDGTLLDDATGLAVAHLSWKAHTKLAPEETNVVLISIQQIPLYLDNAPKDLGLHTEARTSFIIRTTTVNASQEHVALTFLPRHDYEKAAPLTLDPKPDIVTRVFMLFQGVTNSDLHQWKQAEMAAQKATSFWTDVVGVASREGQADTGLFRVLEWGGMEIK